ncbi:hypothetical protein AB0A73_02910 [Glycomyces sp. NPDC047369]
MPLPGADRTEPFEFFHGSGSPLWCADGDDAWVGDEGMHLLGPHFAVTVQCRFSGEELPAAVAAWSSGLTEMPKAENGSEFVVNQVAAEPYEPEFGYAPTSAWVAVGDREFELAQVPQLGDWVVLSAPVDQDAVLWVEDDGRAQGVDMRTGERVDPVFAYYNGLKADAELAAYAYEGIEIADGAGTGWVSCGASGAVAHRRIWREGPGWAAEGHVYLVVELSWCKDLDSFAWNLDRERSVVIASGEAAETVEWTETEAENGVVVSAVFEIPDYDAEVSIDFTPVGEVVDHEGGRWEFREELATTHWTATF